MQKQKKDKTKLYKKMKCKTLENKTLLKTDFFEVQSEKYIKKNKEIVENYYKIVRPDATIITAITKTNKIVMIKQYRQPVRSEDIELPAGYMEKQDKNIKQTAKRELLEETGYKIKKITKLGEAFAQAGFLSNKVYFFIGFDAEKISDQKLDKNEEIKIFCATIKQANEFIEKGKIKDLGSLTGMLLTMQYLKNQTTKLIKKPISSATSKQSKRNKISKI